MTDLAIDLQHVSKSYRKHVYALNDIAMHVRRGEIFGLLGPNGAGKSTLVKIMMTVIRPTHVEGTILGKPVGHKPTLARVGYLPENHRFPKYLTGRQTLEFFGGTGRGGSADGPPTLRRIARNRRHDRGGRKENLHLLQRHVATHRPGTGDDERPGFDRP